MLKEVYTKEKGILLKYLTELWTLDLELPYNSDFEFFDYQINARRTTFRAPHSKARKTMRKLTYQTPKAPKGQKQLMSYYRKEKSQMF